MRKILQTQILTAFMSFGLFALPQVHAAETTDLKDATQFPEPKVWVFGAVEYGYSHLSTSAAGEQNLHGSQFDIKGLLSYYTKDFVFDGGVGWLFNSLNGNYGSITRGVNTRSPFGELDARYRLGPHWQLGPAVDVTFGGDLSLSPFPSSALSPAVLGGLQADYEANPETNSWRIRFIGRAVNSVNLSPHGLFVAQLGIQIGFPCSKSQPTPEPTPTPSIQAAQVLVPEETAVVDAPEKEYVKPVVQIKLEKEFVHFETGSSKLSPESEEFFKNVGAMLAKNNAAWGMLEISGHTDNRGSHALNLKLSQARAASVRTAIVAGGADAEKIQSAGYSFDHPVDPHNNASAWAKNRRVEMNFTDASQPEVIQEQMKKIKKNF